MIDREKVIKEYEDYVNSYISLTTSDDYEFEMHKAVLAMLKEQEAKQVELYGKDDWYGLVCVCPDCKAEWMGGESETHFCPNCGRKVKWE